MSRGPGGVLGSGDTMVSTPDGMGEVGVNRVLTQISVNLLHWDWVRARVGQAG